LFFGKVSLAAEGGKPLGFGVLGVVERGCVVVSEAWSRAPVGGREDCKNLTKKDRKW